MRHQLTNGGRSDVCRRVLALGMAFCLLGCQNELPRLDEPISVYRDRMLVEHQQESRTVAAESSRPMADPVPSQSNLPRRAALPVEPGTTDQPLPDDVLSQVPDPSDAPAVFAGRLERLRQQQLNRQDQRVVRNFERVVEQANEYIGMVALPEKVPIGLAECVQRALEHNYSIRFQAYGPAISQAQIVEAEAAFDVEFYLDASWANLDQATLSAFSAGTSDTRNVEGGLRQRLPAGGEASVGLGLRRQRTDFSSDIQVINPAYNTAFTITLRQPLLRGFGLDINRAQIEISRTDYRISYEQFIQKVRDTLVDVETAYWELARVRRIASVLAESVAQNFITYQNMKERLEHDATDVEVANSESRWQQRYVEYLESIKNIRDAEDQLKNLLNDPELKLSEQLEIIPIETPFVAPMVLDHFAAVRSALDRRSEIREARDQIDRARIGTNVAKNAILPRLDVTFQYELQGAEGSAANAWYSMTRNNFASYTVGAQFAYSFGERAARAAWQRARHQESQAVVALNQVTDFIVEEVNDTIRTLLVRWEQLPPQLASVRAAERNLRALQARTQRIDPAYLETELAAVEQLANTRRTLLTVVFQYNIGIIQLEKAKGTLLDYNNVAVTDVQYGD
jgi:outer membrane protein TolC